MTTITAAKATRGPNKGAAWRRNPEDGMSVIRLALEVSDPLVRHRVEAVFQATFEVRRAVQADARSRVDAYWAAPHERARSPKGTRERLGLDRKALEQAAARHLDTGPHLEKGCTKAMAMHLADNVWTGVERHLFPDASGRRHGRPKVGRWFDFTRIPGRAKSHTADRKWETFRLHGSLESHRDAYRHNGRFHQPKIMRTVTKDGRSWWDHEGPLVVVLTGVGVGDIAVPVRLPSSPSSQSHVDHHLADPSRWHKIDLVRTQDPTIVGGWRYEAHLMVLTHPYVSPGTAAVRAQVPTSRSGGGDLNVSNFTVASHQDSQDLTVTRIERDHAARQAEKSRAKKARNRQKALDRSRRNSNPEQYRPSDAQLNGADRRQAAGLPAKNHAPAGPRKARSDGVPLRAYRRDTTSRSYRTTRAEIVADGASARQARKDHARDTAKAIIAVHGPNFVVEDTNVATWSRQWGRGVAAFAPGRLLSELARESDACGGRFERASTWTTALSQHCLCGHRKNKPLSQRTHECSACGVTADRDAMAATLASHVTVEPGDPAGALLDVVAARRMLHSREAWDTLEATVLQDQDMGRQDAPSAPTHTRPNTPPRDVRADGPPAPAGSVRRTVRQATDATPDETRTCGTTSDSAARNPDMPPSGAHAPSLRDIS